MIAGYCLGKITRQGSRFRGQLRSCFRVDFVAVNMERSVGVWLLILLRLVVVALANTEENDNAVAKHWALIVAGSNGYFNYRHQVRFAFVTVSHLWLYLDSCIQVHCRCYSEIKENIGYFYDSTIETLPLVVANAGVMDLAKD